MISIREAASELKVTPRQLLKWVLKNRIFASLTSDWNILIPRREFERLKVTLGIGTKQIGPCHEPNEKYQKGLLH